jgi:putative methionine-R-sulfoxide reductase with GAF domain
VPLIDKGNVWGVLDVDSIELNDFDAVDKKYLELLVTRIVKAAQ